MTNSMLFEGPLLDEVLSEARLCFGADVEIEAANRVRRGGLFGFFASEWYEVWARPSAAVISNPALALIDDEDSDDTFQQMVRNAMADRRLGGGESGAAPSEYDSALDQFFSDSGTPDPGPNPAPTRQLVPAGAAAGIESASDSGPAMSSAPTAAPVASPMLAATTTSTPRPEADGHAGAESLVSPVSAAVALEDPPKGASVFTAERAPKTDLLWAMLDRLDGLPKAPALPTSSGLVVFVGDAAAALETARDMGERTGLWTGDVAVISRNPDAGDVPSWLLVDDLDELASRSARWRQRDRLVPVVVDQGIEAAERIWARTAITQLAAEQVRLVVESWRLPEDVGKMAGKLGGVDALELVAIADTVEPLAMLDLDIPLSTIEGRPATPELMAAVWLENRRRG